MNIKGILLGSAAALAAVSGAQAADAIVAAAPEPAEYVRVCDAFGTGYFYIPGTETCLKISGYVRAQVDYSSLSGGRNWNSMTRGLVTFDAKNDSEIGTIGSTITLRAWQGGNTTKLNDASGTTNDTNSVEIDEAFITAGGFMVGSFYNPWDSDLSGETDDIGSNRLNSIAYKYTADKFFVYASVDELSGLYSRSTSLSYNRDNNVGVEAQVGGTFGVVTANLLGSYDFAAQEGSVRLLATAEVGPGEFGIAGIYTSGANAYYDLAKWTVAAQYAAKITDKITLTPGIQYWSGTDAALDSGDITKGGLTVDYKIASGLAAKVSAQYQNKDWSGNNDVWTGFVRLQRSF
ncbi:hypothetical protein H4S14_002898 [Agrobacterium vitis]|nr:hypothetical protein [Agrobacterium vitis]MBE1439136.1 hypothetical protein [Agrobacterium vitis]